MEFEKVTLQAEGKGETFSELLKNMTEKIGTLADEAGIDVGPITVKQVHHKEHYNGVSFAKIADVWTALGSADMVGWQTNVPEELARATELITNPRTEEA